MTLEIVSQSLVQELLVMEIPPVDKVLRTIGVYLAVVLVVRVAGKRMLAQMNSLDLVVVLLLSEAIQNAIIGDDFSVSGAVLGVVVLVATNAGLERLAARWGWARTLLEGRSTVLIEDGRIDDAALHRLGMTREELAIALRVQGADSAAEVEKATITQGGQVGVDIRPEEQSASRADLERAVAELRELIEARRT
ncbi:YetF domain-containing protein [Georgenia sp. Z1344]|uniref:YetF domain-containing protein n=1 Tax=Georgenia sp. Z1344 TaxID=3416706 RepID=UPI003CFB1938